MELKDPFKNCLTHLLHLLTSAMTLSVSLPLLLFVCTHMELGTFFADMDHMFHCQSRVEIEACLFLILV